MKLTKCQEKAQFTITDWALNSNDNFVLEGAAGTGKTTIVKNILDDLKNKKKIIVTAPTHQAKQIISEKTNRQAETIHSLLGLRPNIELDNFDPNKPVFDIKAEERIKYYDLVVIDEASMINKNAFDLIIEKSNQYNSKVLFIGDKHQLPPVNELFSKVFTTKNKHSLIEIVRQKESNPNQLLLDIAIKDIDNNTDNLLTFLKDVKENRNDKEEGFVVLNKKEFAKDLLYYYNDSEFKYNYNYIKTLAFQNETIKKINIFIRNNIQKGIQERICNTDILLSYSSIKDNGLKGYTENISKNIDELPIILSNSSTSKIIYFELVIEKIGNVLLKGYKIKLEGISQKLFILHNDSYNDFILEYNRLLQQGIVFKKWKEYYNFKERVLLIDNLKIDNKTTVNKNLDYGYALTTHKSQGSTYTNTAILFSDLLIMRKFGRTLKEKQDNIELSRKLIYVALSRCEKLNLIYYE